MLALLLACAETTPRDHDGTTDTAPNPWGDAVPMTVSVDGQPTVAGTIDGDAVVWALDTGADDLYVDASRLDRSMGHVDVTVGPLDLGTVTAHALDLTDADAAAGLTLGGLVGQTVLGQRAVAFSYATGEAWFADTWHDEAPPPCSGEPAAAPYTLTSGVPVAASTFSGPAGSFSADFVADTGSGVTVLTESAFAALDDGSLPRLSGYVWSTTYGSDDAFLTRIPTITLGEAELDDTWAVVVPDDNHLLPRLARAGLDVDGFVGWPVWREGCLGVDGPGARYLWWDGASGTPEHEWDRVGIEVRWDDPGVSVAWVYSPSSAEGVPVGTPLVSVDGVSLADATLAEARAALSGPPGEVRIVETGGDAAQTYALPVEALLPE